MRSSILLSTKIFHYAESNGKRQLVASVHCAGCEEAYSMHSASAVHTRVNKVCRVCNCLQTSLLMLTLHHYNGQVSGLIQAVHSAGVAS